MTDRPILFSGEMVRAILERRKTQTRRVVKITNRTPGLAACLQPADPNWARPTVAAELCPYGQPGDLLWVRETFAHCTEDKFGPMADSVIYRADEGNAEWKHGWRPSIFMPRCVSRITLEITGVRVERLQDISEADALAEGCEADKPEIWWQGYREHEGYLLHQQSTGDAPPDWMIEPHQMMPTPWLERSAKQRYELLWNQINGAGSWDANPWVWALSFRPHLVNIDRFIERQPVQ